MKRLSWRANEECKLSQHEQLVLMLSAVLRDRREQLEMSQSDLARISGLHRSYIGDLERGSRNVSVRNLSRLAAAVNLSASRLLSLAEKQLVAKKTTRAVKTTRSVSGSSKKPVRRKATVAKKPLKRKAKT